MFNRTVCVLLLLSASWGLLCEATALSEFVVVNSLPSASIFMASEYDSGARAQHEGNVLPAGSRTPFTVVSLSTDPNAHMEVDFSMGIYGDATDGVMFHWDSDGRLYCMLPHARGSTLACETALDEEAGLRVFSIYNASAPAPPAPAPDRVSVSAWSSSVAFHLKAAGNARSLERVDSGCDAGGAYSCSMSIPEMGLGFQLLNVTEVREHVRPLDGCECRVRYARLPQPLFDVSVRVNGGQYWCTPLSGRAPCHALPGGRILMG